MVNIEHNEINDNFKEMVNYVIDNNYNSFMEKVHNKYRAVGLLVLDDNYEFYHGIINILGCMKIQVKYIIKFGEIDFKNYAKYNVIDIKQLKNINKKPDIVFMINTLISVHVSDFIRNLKIKTVILSSTDKEQKRYIDFLEHLLDLYDVYSWLDDVESRKVFLADIIGDYTNCYNKYIFADEPQYLLSGFIPTSGDIAIDGGAYDGQTARDLSMLGAKVYSFELDINNYNKCKIMAEKFNFVIENYGLGIKKSEIRYITADTASRVNEDNGNAIGKIIDIDTYVLENDIAKVDYIKLDVEGSELDALKGAYKTISMFKPKMAISVYHNQEDLWTIAHYIKSIRSDYKFMWRHYPVDLSNDYGMFDKLREIRKDLDMDNLAKATWEKVLYCS